MFMLIQTKEFTLNSLTELTSSDSDTKTRYFIADSNE